MKFLIKLFVVAGLVALLVGVAAWQVPASWVLDRLNWSKQGISIARINGTLWQGGAEQVRRKDLILGDINWDFQTINTLRPLATTWRVEGKGLDYELSLFADVEGRQAQDLRFVQGFIPAGWIDLSKAAPLLFLTGRFNIDLDHASPIGNASRLASGTIRWTDAGLSGLVDEPLGTILIELRFEDRFTIADIQSEAGADTMISGDVKFNGAQYRASLILRTTEEKQYLVEQMAHLGTVMPDGSLELKLSGSMPR